MVFANLSEEDKEAFFALLDEYFESRPELGNALGLNPGRSNAVPSGSQAANLGAAAAHRALASNPQATSAVVSAGLKSVPKSSPYASAASNPEVANAVGRFAAASLAFNGGTPPKPPPARPGNSDLRPPPPPRRSTSSSSLNETKETPLPPPRASPRPKPSKLVSQRKLGDLDTSSGKNMFVGMRKNDPPPPAAPVPAAFAKTKSFAPPPPRRTPSTRQRTPTPEPEPEPESEPEYEGEWAEALYDYKSSDPNDLNLQAEQRVLVTARTSDDWWTGEVDGKSGLFPASYVKVL